MAELTRQDLELIDVVTLRVRVLSLGQVARTWWQDASSPHRSALSQVRKLAAEGLVEPTNVFAAAEIPLTWPVATWQPLLPAPDLAAAARLTRARFARTPVCDTQCVVAARIGRRRPRPPRETETTHDLHLAGVYLWMRANLPTRAAKWLHEDEIADDLFERAIPGEKRPDAVVRDGGHLTAVELVGSSYSGTKLQAFHDFCAERGLAYELW